MHFIVLTGWISTAQASPVFETIGSNYTTVEGSQVLENKRQNALKKTLESTNIVVRTLAASKLEHQPNMCVDYVFSYSTNTLHVKCDEHPSIAVHLDGRPTKYPKKDDTFLEVVAEVKGNTILQTFPFANGSLKVIYRLENDQFWVEKSIYSSYLGMPLSVSSTYVPTN